MSDPRKVYRWAVRACLLSGPAAFALLTAWAFRLPGLEGRPHLVTMVYMLATVVAVASGGVALLAGCHMATHRAFAAGFRAGVDATTTRPDPERVTLRVVE